MAVKTYDLAGGGERRATPPPRPIPMAPLGVVALVVGMVFWLLGARYTLAGWVEALNIAMTVIGLPARVPAPAGWWWLLAIPLGLIYSLAELRITVSWPRAAAQIPAWIVAVVILGLIHASDVGSTALGYLRPAEDAWAIHRWAAGPGWPVLGGWAIVLTYLPERCILWGARWVRGGWW